MIHIKDYDRLNEDIFLMGAITFGVLFILGLIKDIMSTSSVYTRHSLIILRSIILNIRNSKKVSDVKKIGNIYILTYNFNNGRIYNVKIYGDNRVSVYSESSDFYYDININDKKFTTESGRSYDITDRQARKMYSSILKIRKNVDDYITSRT